LVVVIPRRLLGRFAGQLVRQRQGASRDLRRNTRLESLLLSAAAPWIFLMADVLAWACIAVFTLALASMLLLAR
jgi:hypothetical protein